MRALAAKEEPAYEAFLASCRGSLLYYTLGFRDLLCALLGCRAEYLVSWRGDTITGVLPIMWRDGIANALPFYGSHGGPLGEASLDAWDERATDPSTRAATLVENPFAPLNPERVPIHDRTDARISQVTPLPHIPSGSAARNVRRAAGYTVTTERDALGELRGLHEGNLAALGGLAKPAAFFDLVPRHLPGYELWTARSADGELAAALLTFASGVAIEYYTPAVAAAHRPGQPLAAILARAMERGRARGFSHWNWGGTWTNQDGVHRFKRKWGAVERRYRYFTVVNDPALDAASPDELRAAFPHFYVRPFGGGASGAS